MIPVSLKNTATKALVPVLRYLRCLGVQFEGPIPPEFIVTFHGQTRMLERFKCDKRKIKKVIAKAWHYGGMVHVSNKVIQKYKPVRGKTDYKYYLGHVFVFNVVQKPGYLLKTLITVYKYNNKSYVSLKNRTARLSTGHR